MRTVRTMTHIERRLRKEGGGLLSVLMGLFVYDILSTQSFLALLLGFDFTYCVPSIFFFSFTFFWFCFLSVFSALTVFLIRSSASEDGIMARHGGMEGKCASG